MTVGRDNEPTTDELLEEQVRLLSQIRDLLEALVAASPESVGAYRRAHGGNWPPPA